MVPGARRIPPETGETGRAGGAEEVREQGAFELAAAENGEVECVCSPCRMLEVYPFFRNGGGGGEEGGKLSWGGACPTGSLLIWPCLSSCHDAPLYSTLLSQCPIPFFLSFFLSLSCPSHERQRSIPIIPVLTPHLRSPI